VSAPGPRDLPPNAADPFTNSRPEAAEYNLIRLMKSIGYI
jgi:hypothetical protein